MLILLGAIVVICAGAVLVISRSGGDSAAARRSPADRIASFSAAATISSLPKADERKGFVEAFSHGRSTIRTLDLDHLRRFALGDPDEFSLVAAPDAKGGVCYLDSTSGGTCLDSFHDGAGMTLSFRKVNGVKHHVITGLVPDGVSKLIFDSARARHAVAVHDNLFQFVIPTSDRSRFDSYTLVADDGSSTTERWPVPFPNATPRTNPLGP